MTGPPPTPPKWKTAIVTLVAVFPPVLFFNVAVIPFLGGVPLLVRTLTLCVGVTSAVTWVMMPRLMPLVKNWLNAPSGAAAPAETRDRGPRRPQGVPQRDADLADEGDARPAWLLDMPAGHPGPRYGARRQAVSAPPPANGDDAPAPHPGNRRTPGYGGPPEPSRQSFEYRTDEYQTVEFRPVGGHRDERWARTGEREDDYYEEPARYGRYDETEWPRVRDQEPGTGRRRR